MAEKLTPRRQAKNTVNAILTYAEEAHGTGRSTEYAKKFAVGECPKCGSLIIRPVECTHGVCTCESATVVPIRPLYEFLQPFADRFGASVEDVLAVAMHVGLEKVKKMHVQEVIKLARV